MFGLTEREGKRASFFTSAEKIIFGLKCLKFVPQLSLILSFGPLRFIIITEIFNIWHLVELLQLGVRLFYCDTIGNRTRDLLACSAVPPTVPPRALLFSNWHINNLSIPVAARSKAWVCGCSLAGIVGSNPAEGMNVCCECCVLSGRGLCVELITRPAESYQVWCV
jgi:hypothetical protein